MAARKELSSPAEKERERPLFVSLAGKGEWSLLVRVVPGANKTEYAGEQGGRLRIRLAAPAVENKANKALLAFIAKTFGLRTSRVTLLSGETGRHKRLLILSEEEPDWTKVLPAQAED